MTTTPPGATFQIVGDFSHSFIELKEPDNWSFFVSHYDGHVKRLVVFVHGFRGESVGTWMDFPFPVGETAYAWWNEADLLFVGYNSMKETITGVANRLRLRIADFYPQPCPKAMEIGGVKARQLATSLYDELVLVGHSLGGVILRRALCDAAQEWNPTLIETQLRSPHYYLQEQGYFVLQVLDFSRQAG